MNEEQTAVIAMALATTVFNQAEIIRKLSEERDELLSKLTALQMIERAKV